MTATTAIPRFNHVAMSLPAEALDEAGRTALLDFYGEVFGWTEMPTMTVDRERLVVEGDRGARSRLDQQRAAP